VVRPLRAVSFAVVDVETTGSSPVGGDRITEFCAVIVKGREVVDSFETLVNPLRPIPENVTALTRITWNMVREAPTFVDVAPRVAELLRGHVFVAHNATFDWRFVSQELAQSGCLVSGERLCTVKLARAVLPAVRRRSLDALTYHYGIENHARTAQSARPYATSVAFVVVGATPCAGVELRPRQQLVFLQEGDVAESVPLVESALRSTEVGGDRRPALVVAPGDTYSIDAEPPPGTRSPEGRRPTARCRPVGRSHRNRS
jgi:DNA polymerase-3 subunit epsilon